MCGFTGFVNIKEKLKEDSKIILEKMQLNIVCYKIMVKI